MTDDQIKVYLGVDETMQMLQVREMVKANMTPELYELNMSEHKASIRAVIAHAPRLSPIEAAEVIFNMMEADTSVDEDQREMWKALVLIAAFEMQEF